MTTETELRKDERAVTVTIKSKAESTNANGEPDYKLEVTADFFKSKYATIIFVPTAAGNLLKTGGQATMVLHAQLKEGKSGQKPFDYNWRFVRLATKDDIGPSNGVPTDAQPGDGGPAPPMPQAAAARKAAALARDPQRDSIERQVAAKLAMDWVISRAPPPDQPVDIEAFQFHFDQAFDHALDRIQNRPPDASGAIPSDAVPDGAPTNVDSLPFDPSQEP